MQTVYFISGLGADERAFGFLDLSFCNPVFLKWLKPQQKETISSYAARMKAQIPEENPIIVGLSFGGIMSVEIAKQLTCKKVILLASAKTGKEIPFYLRIMRYLPFHKLTGPSFLKYGNRFVYKLMGIEERSDKVVFTQMLQECDNDFLVWAVDAIINWKNREVPGASIHIHGTRDIMLPHYFVKADYIVKGGEHLMVMSKPAEISRLLRQILVEPE